AFYVTFWVGAQFASALFGGVWAAVNPIATLALALERLRRGPALVAAPPPPRPAEDPMLVLVGLGGFTWLELAFHEPAIPRLVAVAIVLYSVPFVVGGARHGIAWLERNEGFAVLFDLIGHLSPIGRRSDGTAVARVPGSALARAATGASTTAAVMVVLGGTTFDGFSRTRLWRELVSSETGWSRTAMTTIGLVFIVAVVAAVYFAAAAAAGRVTGEDARTVADTFAPSLVPIALAYSVAHYFSLFVLDGQAFLFRLGDPFAWDWNLFGLAERSVNYRLVSASAIAWTQVVAVVAGHVAGVVVAHDRAVQRYPAGVATRSQIPMVLAMVGFTIAALLLLLGA
ncbi:MAG: hypothetical protein OEV72_14295, partial [Thermoleophilia bacterium]|nr:hypothetical protein [Thermoleophilia bacterium]